MSHKYQWRGNELVVFDVPVMSYITERERGVDIGPPEFAEMVKMFNWRVDKGKAGAYLFRGHNSQHKDAEIIGRLEGLRFVEPWLRADAVITEPVAQQKALRGELPNWSAEAFVAANTTQLKGLSLIDGKEGHFSEEEADFLPTEELETELVALGAEVKPLRGAAHEVRLSQEIDMEEIEALKAQLAEAMKRIEELNAIVSKSMAAESDTSTPAEEAEAMKSQLAALEAKTAKLAAENKIGSAVIELKSKGCHLTEKTIRERLAACKTDEGFAKEVALMASLEKPAAQEDGSKSNAEQKRSGTVTLNAAGDIPVLVREFAEKHSLPFDVARARFFAQNPDIGVKARTLALAAAGIETNKE